MPQEPIVRDKLNALGIDALCDRIASGVSLTALAESLEISRYAMSSWIAADENRSARAREARIIAASAYADLALAAIKDAPANPIELSRARELASHYRWQASKASPQEYGDKVETTHKGEMQITAIERRIVG
jgi:hypothetical protein